MDRLTPLALETASFDAEFRGYRRADVRQLLKRASDEMERLLTENRRLQLDMEGLQRELDAHRSQENKLKDTLLLAQRTADETRATAHREADLILEEARQRAREAQQEMQSRVNDLRWEIERLHLERQKFTAQFRSLLEQHLATLTPTVPQTPEVSALVEVGPEIALEEPGWSGVPNGDLL